MDYTGLEEEIERRFLSGLSAERAEHSRSTADYARFLAERYEVSCEKSYLAGLCHDLAKEKKNSEILRLPNCTEERHPGR